MGTVLRTLALCLAFIAGPAAAGTLSDAFADAYRYSASLAASRAELVALGETVPQARAGARPNLSLSGTTTLNESFRSGAGTTQGASVSIGLSGSQTLYDGGATAASVSQAEVNIAAARARYDAAEQQLLLSVAQAFITVLRDREAFYLTLETFKVLEQQLVAAEARFEVGEVTLTDVAQTRARLASARASVLQARGAIDRSEAQFERLVGRKPQNPVAPALPPPLPVGREQAAAEAVANAPSVRAAALAERAATQAIRAAMAGASPRLTLNGGLNHDLQRGDSRSESASATVSLSLTAPIYQGGITESRVRQARLTATQRRHERRDAERSARLAAVNAWDTYQTARAAVDAGAAQVSASELAFEGVNEELKVGARATIDLLNAEQELLNARLSLVSSAAQVFTAAFDLRLAIGRLDPTLFALDPPAPVAVPEVNLVDILRNRSEDAYLRWGQGWRP